jgi:hypothetical protein
MLAGDLYIADDPELARDSLRAMRLMAKFNQGAADSPAERRRILKELLGAIGEDRDQASALLCTSSADTRAGGAQFDPWRQPAGARLAAKGPHVTCLAVADPAEIPSTL